MSKLIVEVCSIDNIIPIEKADNIEVAQIKGWFCIVQKNQYKVGDAVVFIPPDSMLPDNLVEKYNLTYLKNGSRVRVLKLRGFVSQGLILPTDCLPVDKKFKIGDDVTTVLGITKWEPPPPRWANLGDRKPVKKRHTNQNFVKYTDIDNIRNYNTVFKDDELVYISEKIHGSNWRAGLLQRTPRKGFWGIFDRIAIKIFGEYEYVYGSHNVQLQAFTEAKNTFYKENVYSEVAKKYNISKILPKNSILYGEVYGKNIQDLNYGSKEVDLVIFDLKINDVYVSYYELVTFCEKHKLKMVPTVYVGKYSEAVLKEHTKGDSILAQENGVKQIREGVVIKPLYETVHPKIGRKILKSISEDYLTRKGETTEYH